KEFTMPPLPQPPARSCLRGVASGPRRRGPASLLGGLGLAVLLGTGCAPTPEMMQEVGGRPQAVPIGGACADNSDCDAFDNDTRLIVCDVPAGMMSGTCVDCLAPGAR